MEWIIAIGVIILFLPFLIYALNKAATWGRLKATYEFGRTYTRQYQRQQKQQEENNHGEEKKE